MGSTPTIDITDVITALLLGIGVALALAVMLLGWVLWRVRRVNLPPDADFITALLLTPLSVVVLLDLLDLSLDLLSMPISWVVLGRIGLAPLRGVTLFEAFIPGTQFIPTMTVAWVFARLFFGRTGYMRVPPPASVRPYPPASVKPYPPALAPPRLPRQKE